jgi:hypothetical protein
VIPSELKTSSMRPWRHLARAAAPLDELLDKPAADAKERRETPLRAAVFVISTEDFLAKIEGIRFHGVHAMASLPFTQV